MEEASRGRHRVLGHVFAFTTCLVWGFTYVASKVLLNAGLDPFETMVIRFVIAYLALWLLRPRMLPFEGWRKELPFILCGIFGVTVYYLFEYYSLTFTSANYTGIITGTAPLMVALMMWAVYKERPKRLFVIGFFVAIFGITLITLGGGNGLEISLVGGLLAFGGTVSWAAYCAVLRKIDKKADTLLATRRIFFWALVTLALCAPVLGFDVSDVNFASWDVIAALLMLGLIASALCYNFYNVATAWIGAVKTSAYIYFSPVVNAVGAFFILGEQLLLPGIIGIAVIIVGLVLSERGS
jgi:drug/metabolite transporter (DMT)-like permease